MPAAPLTDIPFVMVCRTISLPYDFYPPDPDTSGQLEDCGPTAEQRTVDIQGNFSGDYLAGFGAIQELTLTGAPGDLCLPVTLIL